MGIRLGIPLTQPSRQRPMRLINSRVTTRPTRKLVFGML